MNKEESKYYNIRMNATQYARTETVQKNQVNLQTLFQQFAGTKGYLSNQDLIQLYSQTGVKMTEAEVRIHLKYAGATDNRVTFQEFQNFARQN